jgi:hypothetical protein
VDRPVREHINELEKRLKRLAAKSMENQLSRNQRNAVETEMRVVTLALSRFREALDLEQQLQRP